MIEAVNSATANAYLSRGVALQAGGDAARPSPLENRSAPEAPQAPYVSPYIAVDLTYDRAVLQIRNAQTGEVERQYPSESRLQQLAQVEQRTQSAEQLRESISYQAPTNTSNASSQSLNVVTVQEVTSAAPSNEPSSSPQNAVAALSAGVQQAPATQTVSVDVLA